ncbi:hypothetical protein BCR42DRAFT_456216 [Absidia repens]|uniref:Ketoreductase domain-containing protein n=1 Tax=Absidia repens TaxID=90262 RepID=A0A1X2I0V7_9FUNG|nr:hypothetical protein BCR42DRAFT_456216 [Absidia repens]
MSATDRLNTIKGHLSGNYPQGLLAGEVAIITGSAQGIGKSCAELFAREGAYVVVTDIDAEKAAQVAADLTNAGYKAIAIPGNILDADFAEKLIEGTVKAFGRINHIVNNAGFTFDGMIHKTTDKQWDMMLAVHNTAPFKIIRAAAKYLRQKDGANKTIVNISSTSGLHGNIGQANYATAKAGVVGFTKTIAKEWGAFGVRANTVAFGWVDTRLTRAKETGAAIEVDGQKVALGIPTGNKSGARINPYADIPLGRSGNADEVAGSVMMMCSPFSSYISGHTLEVTGGRGI